MPRGNPNPMSSKGDHSENYHGLSEGLQIHAGQGSAFSGVSAQQWSDWQWHVRNRITSVSELEKWIPMTVEEKRAIHFSQDRSRFSLSPYWVSLMDPEDLACPIRRQAIP